MQGPCVHRRRESAGRMLGRRRHGVTSIGLPLLLMMIGSSGLRTVSNSAALQGSLPTVLQWRGQNCCTCSDLKVAHQPTTFSEVFPRVLDCCKERAEEGAGQDQLRWTKGVGCMGSGHKYLGNSLRLKGGGGGLEWIERRLNTVFSSASKIAGSPSGGPSVEDQKEGRQLHTPASALDKSQLWQRFEMGFDSLKTERKDPFRSLSPLSSPEGVKQKGDAGESSVNRAPPKMVGSWFGRRFNDAFASEAPTPADASRLSNRATPASLSSPSCSEEGPQVHRSSHSRHGARGPQFGHLLQQASEISEEMSAGGTSS